MTGRPAPRTRRYAMTLRCAHGGQVTTVYVVPSVLARTPADVWQGARAANPEAIMLRLVEVDDQHRPLGRGREAQRPARPPAGLCGICLRPAPAPRTAIERALDELLGDLG